MQGFLDAFKALNQLVNYTARFDWFSLPDSSHPLDQRSAQFYGMDATYQLIRLAGRREFTRLVLRWLLHFDDGKIDADLIEEGLDEQLQAVVGEQKPVYWRVDQRAGRVSPLGDVGWDLFLCETSERVWGLYCGWSD